MGELQEIVSVIMPAYNAARYLEEAVPRCWRRLGKIGD